MPGGSVRLLRRFIPFAIVAALAACSPGDADPAVDEGILLVTEAGGGVSLVPPSGGERTRLRPDDGSPSPIQPTASRDGRRIVWSEAGSSPGVAVWEDGELTEVPTEILPFFYLWSPDGESFLALGNDPGGTGVAGLLVDPDAPSAVTLGTAAPFYVDWYPDGEALAAHRDSAEVGRLSRSGRFEPVDLDPGPFQAPAVTPTGDLLVSADPGGGQTTAEVRPISLLQAGTANLTLIPADGGEPRVLLPLEGPSAFAVDPGGERVAVAEGTPGGGHQGRLVVVGLDGGNQVDVSDRRPLLFDWSPDGSRLLYVTVDTEEGTLVPHVWDGGDSRSYPSYRPTVTTAREYLPFWDQYERSLSLWSPAGDAFVYAGLDDESAGRILVQPLEEAGPVDVGPGEWASWIPSMGGRG